MIPSEYASLARAIRDGELDAAVAEALHLVRDGRSAFELFAECVEPCVREIGERFARLEIFLPEMLESAEAIKAVQAALEPLIKEGKQSAGKGRVVLGTAYSDLHDIGKNIVKTMFEVNGFEVTDLGVDVQAAAFVRAARECNADVVAISALMLPALPYARDAINLLKENPALAGRVKVLVGGGPVTREWAAAAGADGYGRDASEAVLELARLCGQEMLS